MKTILVIYTNTKITSKKEIGKMKKYSFNTESEVKEGDMIKTKEYDTNLQVVKVLETSYKYYNSSTGEMSDQFNSSLQWEIRTLVIREEEEDVIYGQKIKE